VVPGGWWLPWLLGDSVDPFSLIVFGRLDRQAQLLRDISANESPNAVGLPVGRFGDLGCRRLVPAVLVVVSR